MTHLQRSLRRKLLVELGQTVGLAKSLLHYRRPSAERHRKHSLFMFRVKNYGEGIRIKLRPIH